MNKVLMKKFSEAAISVFPVTAIVILLNLTPLVDFAWRELTVFLIAAFFMILGIALFNLGADLAMMPMGDHLGAGLVKTRKIPLLLAVCFTMGVLITVAEPDLSVLAAQVGSALDGGLLILSVGVGVGVFLLLSVLKILFKKPLASLLIFFYMVLFAFASLVVLNGNTGFLALAFDSGGVTTGPITVPFIMALGSGIAATLGGTDAQENSFGLIALCSIGPVLAVMALGVGMRGELIYELPDYSIGAHLGDALGGTVLETAEDVLTALGLIVFAFFLLQVFCLHLPKRKLLQITAGILYTFAGLVIFLTAVTVGFMPIGYKMGADLAENHPTFLIVSGFVLGTVVVLAEPAVHVLNKQVEDVTGGSVGKRSMMLALSLGVGVSIGLSMLRAVLGFNILYYLIPGYFVSLGLSFFVPGLYTAIAFDSGGVASGPLTSGFILPFAIGACAALHGVESVLTDAFGIVAMVAMTPLITIQILGFRAILVRKVQEKAAMRRILSADDEQIIDFM